MKRALAAVWVAAAVSLVSAAARAQQFTVVDITYEHKYEYASHYRVKPSAETPANWVSPIDYRLGRVYGHLEVLSKPSNELAEFTICFEGTPTYACTGSPKYSTTGVYDWNTPFSRMLQAGQVDWTKKPSNVALIQKDGNYVNIEPSKIGEERARLFLPTRLRVVVTFVAAGATYVPPPSTSPDAGVRADASPARADAAARDGSGAQPTDAVADSGRSDGAGGSPGGPDDAGTAPPDREAAPPPPKGSRPPTPTTDDEAPAPNARAAGGCAVAPGPHQQRRGFVLLAACALVVISRRRRSDR